MKRPTYHHLKIVAALLIAVISCTAYVVRTVTRDRRVDGHQATSLDQLPHVVLWVWERPTDLRFLRAQHAAVAFLARTVHVKDNRVVIQPRMQPLELPEDIKLIAVARIETGGAVLSGEQAQPVAAAITELTSLPRISAIQIDFDATKSEQPFYREVILRVRRGIGPDVPLSITALTSWCVGDDWLGKLPINEAVPMLFRMGPDGRQIANRLDADDDFRASVCRESYGISVDEQPPKLLAARRLYVFNPEPWTEKSVHEILEPMK